MINLSRHKPSLNAEIFLKKEVYIEILVENGDVIKIFMDRVKPNVYYVNFSGKSFNAEITLNSKSDISQIKVNGSIDPEAKNNAIEYCHKLQPYLQKGYFKSRDFVGCSSVKLWERPL